MAFTARFLALGARVFVPSRTFGRVPFQAILYLFLWAGAWRVVFNSPATPEIPLRTVLSGWADLMWDVLALGCPPLALVAWLMLTHGSPHAKLRGHWLRLSADAGMFISLLTFHVATAIATSGWGDDATAYNRYVLASCIVFIAILVIRDIWVLKTISRVAAGIRDDRFQ